MKKTLYVGLAVSAHNNSVLNSTLFDNVKVTADKKRAMKGDTVERVPTISIAVRTSSTSSHYFPLP
jgi:hypothetical protein